MPIYEYECEDCGAGLEVIQKASDPRRKKCPKCGGKLKKKISAPAIQFKGTGWYVTDYAKKGAPKPEGAKLKGDKPSSAKKDEGAPPSGKDPAPKP